MSEQVAAGKLSQDVASRCASVVLISLLPYLSGSRQLAKLIFFSLSLGLVPITSYFGSLKYLWNGNTTYAALTAVVGANIVLAAYITISILDDQRTTTTTVPEKESKKNQ
ncbi:hypothetical protein GGX14DRAFT_344897 [Mycena pura]|uniref:Vacuolar ATPase assembly integral membrane protein VMA21 n=1 Tax=Mycena pura TaxID=153505 RepID=A0AAD6YTM5_9AGAR|nr:hypothetical protein GGX14DRAFT_344897 [Mycena pura]